MTQATLDHLDGEYDVEDGNGGERNAYLHDKKIKTFLVVANHP